MTRSYPVQLRLAGKRVLVAGAGRVATRKVERLVESGAELLVVSPEVSEPIARLAESKALTLERRNVRAADATGALLVIAATNDRVVNLQLAADARAAGALVSRVDDPDDCDFTVPAVARAHSVEVTVSTRGLAPSASRRLARELHRWLASGPERFVSTMSAARIALAGLPDAGERLRALADSSLFDACTRGDEPAIESLVARALGEDA